MLSSILTCSRRYSECLESSYGCLRASVYLQQGIISAAHILLPYLVAVCVASIDPHCSLGSFPVPIFTKTNRFLLDFRYAMKKGEREIEDEEEKEDQMFLETDVGREMKKNDRDTLNSQIVESTCESSFQFFLQTLWMMPNIIFIALDTSNYHKHGNTLDFINWWRLFSVVSSFLSVGFAFSNIR